MHSTGRLTIREWLGSKRSGATVLFQLLKHLENGWDVWRRRRRGQPVARLALRGGPPIHARPEDDGIGLFGEIVVQRCYTQPWFYRPRPTDTVVDVGANVGCFVLECQHRAPGIRVHAVEPNPSTFEQLLENVKRNELQTVVTAYQLAVSDQRGSLYLEPGGYTTGHQGLTRSGDGQPVRCETLDDLFARAGIERCDLLKIDTEGGEVSIVEGATPDLWDAVERVVLEYHRPDTGSRLERYLTGLGFQCRREPNPGCPHLGLLYARK